MEMMLISIELLLRKSVIGCLKVLTRHYDEHGEDYLTYMIQQKDLPPSEC